MTTKTHDSICQKWIEFWMKKGSLFIQNKDTLISSEIILRSNKISDQDKLNLFFTINGFKKGSKSWKSKNITQLNAFFFDIDLGKGGNENITKREAYELIEPYSNFFDFIVESGSGYHLYILTKDGKYNINNLDVFISDWKQKGLELEATIGLEFDKACFLPTQLARVSGSLHQKDTTKTPTIMKLIKGLEILFPTYERQKTIDSVPIRQVLEALGIEYQGDRIIEDRILTSGWKIISPENYINDLSNKGRPVGGPFAFVKLWYLRKQSISDSDATAKTYHFFAERFGIIQSNIKHKTVPIPEVVERYFIESNLTGKEIRAILSLISYSRMYFGKQLPYGMKISAYASEILKTVGLSVNTSNYIKLLKRIEDKIETLFIRTSSTRFPLLKLKIEKVNNNRMIEFLILPKWYEDKKQRASFYLTHYLKSKLFEIDTNSEDLKFYLNLTNEFISINKDFDYEISKYEICKFFRDGNFTRVKKKIEKIMSTTKDFTFSMTSKYVQFQKA